uniref:C-type lectin domain-containing protein n=1 Tax=Cyprinodon variegatus TaxID=28743 RepID=A0A3Q2D507_CYPVA
ICTAIWYDCLCKIQHVIKLPLCLIVRSCFDVFFVLYTSKTCPTGWNKFSCSCYFLSTKSGSWDEGRKDCITRGADLVVINDKEEQVLCFANEAAWIGLIDKETEGSWKWVDGTSMTLSFWVDNQPDNGGKDYGAKEEDCAHIRTGEGWNDLPCSYLLNWICEKANHFTV